MLEAFGFPHAAYTLSGSKWKALFLSLPGQHGMSRHLMIPFLDRLEARYGKLAIPGGGENSRCCPGNDRLDNPDKGEGDRSGMGLKILGVPLN